MCIIPDFPRISYNGGWKKIREPTVVLSLHIHKIYFNVNVICYTLKNTNEFIYICLFFFWGKRIFSKSIGTVDQIDTYNWTLIQIVLLYSCTFRGVIYLVTVLWILLRYCDLLFFSRYETLTVCFLHLPILPYLFLWMYSIYYNINTTKLTGTVRSHLIKYNTYNILFSFLI